MSKGDDLQDLTAGCLCPRVPGEEGERAEVAELQVGQHDQPPRRKEDEIGDGSPADPARPRGEDRPPEMKRPPEIRDQDDAAHRDGQEAQQIDHRQAEVAPQPGLEVRQVRQDEQPATDPHQREPRGVRDAPYPLDLRLQGEPIHEHVLRTDLLLHGPAIASETTSARPVAPFT
jgi:hypothetical protein